LDALEAEVASLRQSQAILWALAPQWLTACLPHALSTGWTIEIKPHAIMFLHADRKDEYPVSLPLTDDLPQQRVIQREVHMRVGYIGQTGLKGVETPQREVRPRIMDLRD
jgi:hypothetical protein